VSVGAVVCGVLGALAGVGCAVVFRPHSMSRQRTAVLLAVMWVPLFVLLLVGLSRSERLFYLAAYVPVLVIGGATRFVLDRRSTSGTT
jgi:Ca2+/Na+ antiporter